MTRKPVDQMSPAELQELFTESDLEAMHEQVSGDGSFDSGFRERIAEAAGVEDAAPGAMDGGAAEGNGPASTSARSEGCICSYRTVDPQCPLHGKQDD